MIMVFHLSVSMVEGQCTNHTRPFSPSSSNTVQYFSSPGYPNNYPPNSDCAWLIEAPNEYDKIILNVQLFRTQQDEFLRIYDGANANGTLLEKIDDTNQNTFNAYVSPGNQLYFTFQSDGANETNGFNILFFSNQTANQHACGETITISSTPRLFMSPNLPNLFTAEDNCNWLFTSKNGTIRFQIFFMDMASCKPEYLSFYDGTSDTSALLVQVCETAYEYEFDEIQTTGTNAYVKWTVSQDAIGYGFMFAYILGGDDANTTTAITTTTAATDPTTKATAGTDATIATTADTDATKATTAGTDATKATTADTDATIATTADTDATKATTAGTDATKATTAGTDATKATTAGTDATIATTAGTDATIATTAGTNATEATTAGTDATIATTAGTDATIATTAGTDATTATTAGTNATKATTAGTDATIATTAGTDATKATTAGTDATIATTAGTDATKATTAGPDETTKTTADHDETTVGPDPKAPQDFLGINLTYPLANETVEIVLPEDQQTGYVNKSVALIVLTTTGELDLNIDPRYESTTDQNVNIADDVEVFLFTKTDAPYYYLSLSKSLDYEVINMFCLIVTLEDSNVTSVTYTVTFNITITDVNDVAPVILNLPNNVTLSRNENSGYHIFTLNASDGDGTVENQIISYRIVSGNQDGIFSVDNTSGEVSLIKDTDQIPANVEEYNLTISAYSGDIAVQSSRILTVSIPNDPPNCTHNTVWAHSLDLTTASTGYTLTFPDAWSCSDAGDTLTYSIASVSPNLTSAFGIDSSSGIVSLFRTISSSEVPNRQIVLEIAVKDKKGQTVSFSLYMNVTTMTCLPNPRNLYVRMDQELGGVILDNFNCTVNSGLTFSMKQYPPGTFEINGNSQLILRAAVFKIKFYGLTVTITHGSDVVVLTFKVIFQTKRCGVSGGLSHYVQYNKIGIAFFFFSWTSVLLFYFL